MPRSKPLPRPEKVIARRLKEVRRWTRLAQTQFAQALGIGRERLASYENGRAVLPFQIGEKICRLWPINPFWLANGTGSRIQRYFMRVATLPRQTAFSAVVATLREASLHSVEKDPTSYPNVAISALDLSEATEPVEYFDPDTVRLPAFAAEVDVGNRLRAIQEHGRRCCVCGFSPAEAFGVHATRILQIHATNPDKNEFVPLCPTCHALVHTRNPPMSIDELKEKGSYIEIRVPEPKRTK